MIRRKVPGALALGLLASLVAHTALYGGDHAMAGGYHGEFVLAAAAAALGLLIGLSALAWSARGGVADGSIVAARLGDRLPSVAYVVSAAALWLWLAEAIEPSHPSAFGIVTALCLAAAAWTVTLVARAIVAALASAIIAICRLAFSSRTPSWNRRPRSAPLRRDVLCVRRRFARSPPVALAQRA